MKTDELKSRGLTEDQIDFVMKQNGQDLKKLQTEVEKLTGERDALKQRAETAEATLQKFDGVDVDKFKGEIAEWKRKAEEAEENAKDQLYKRDFADALKEALESVKFTSEAAKRDVTAQINAAGLKLKDGKILGLSDLLEQIKNSDASAFVDEHQEHLEENKARFTAPQGHGSGRAGTITKNDIMAIKDPGERQNAIAQNLALFGQKGD